MSQPNHRVPEIGDRLVRIPEAAKILALSERQVWHLLESGALPAVRIGRTTRIRASDLLRMIKLGIVAGEARDAS